jgi:hypothetical protein
MTIEYRADHVSRGLENLTSRYDDATAFRDLVSIYLCRVQMLEDIVYGLIIAWMLDNAVKPQLDVLGKIVGQERCGTSDFDYRAFVRARVVANSARGRIPKIQFVLKTQMAADSASYLPHPPAAYTIQSNGATVSDACKTLVRETMEEIAPAGVRVDVVDAPVGAFGFEGDDDALGFGQGVWAQIL